MDSRSSPPSPPDVLRAQARIDSLNDLAWDVRDTDPDRFHSFSEEAHRLSTSGPFGVEPYRRGVIKSLRGLSLWNQRAGHLTLALSQCKDALLLLESDSMDDVRTDILRNIAIVLGSLGNYAEALEFGMKALRLARPRGDRIREAAVLGSVGVIHTHAKNAKEGLQAHQHAREIHRELGLTREEALALNNMSVCHGALDDYKSALSTAQEALRLAEESGFVQLVVTATGTIGEACLCLGDYEKAMDHFRHFLAAAQASGAKRNQAWALLLLGETHLRLQRLDSAGGFLTRALEVAREEGLRSEEARCRQLLVSLHEQRGELAQAIAELRAYQVGTESMFNETSATRIATLNVVWQLELARMDAEIHHLRTAELQEEIAERKKSQEALEKLATTDSLTEVLNRRQFMPLAETMIRSALEREQPVTMIMPDVDHFKTINDRYGHATGDQVLVTVAALLRANSRKQEIVVRLGGDEFAILLPGIDLSRIAEAIARDSGSLDALLERADRAMYEAKRSGRDSVSDAARR